MDYTAIILEKLEGQGFWTVVSVILIIIIVTYQNRENKAKTDDLKAFQDEQSKEQRKHFDAYKKDSKSREERYIEQNTQLLQQNAQNAESLKQVSTALDGILVTQQEIVATQTQFAVTVDSLQRDHISLVKEVNKIKEDQQ